MTRPDGAFMLLLPGTKVHLPGASTNGLPVEATVQGINIDGVTISYRVTWWAEGERKSEWVHVGEIRSIDGVTEGLRAVPISAIALGGKDG